MTHITKDHTDNQPEYIIHTRAQARIKWIISSAVILVYAALVLLIALTPGSIGDSRVTLIGIAIGAGVILMGFIVTWIYAYQTNLIDQENVASTKKNRLFKIRKKTEHSKVSRAHPYCLIKQKPNP